MTYPAGTHQVTLKVTDSHGAHHSDTVTIHSGETPPTVSIDSPGETLNWHVGQTINFAGSATDDQDGSLPAAALSWNLVLNHCVTVDACHSHPVQDFAGVSSGAFVGPDHGYPSHLMLQVTATDSAGLTDTKTIRLDPQTANLIVRSAPAGLNVSVDEKSGPGPLVYEGIVGATTTIAAETPQSAGATHYGFGSWSDGKAQSHEITVPATDETYTATFDELTKLTFLPGRGCPRRAGKPEHQLRDVDQAARGYRRGSEHAELPALQRDRRHRHGRERKAEAVLHARRPSMGPRCAAAADGWTETGVNWSNQPDAGASVIDDRSAIAANYVHRVQREAARDR